MCTRQEAAANFWKYEKSSNTFKSPFLFTSYALSIMREIIYFIKIAVVKDFSSFFEKWDALFLQGEAMVKWKGLKILNFHPRC